MLPIELLYVFSISPTHGEMLAYIVVGPTATSVWRALLQIVMIKIHMMK